VKEPGWKGGIEKLERFWQLKRNQGKRLKTLSAKKGNPLPWTFERAEKRVGGIGFGVRKDKKKEGIVLSGQRSCKQSQFGVMPEEDKKEGLKRSGKAKSGRLLSAQRGKKKEQAYRTDGGRTSQFGNQKKLGEQ